MSDRCVCVYCAGPLFNRSERDEMSAIAHVLCEAGYETYLPHRDGMEFRLVHEVLVERGWEAPTAAGFLHAAIFAVDVFQLVERCDAVVWNLNGRTPDEGAVAEAAIAWSLGKPLVAYRDDVRSLIAGRINPLLSGLVDFTTSEEMEDIPQALARSFERRGRPAPPRWLSEPVQKAVQDGALLWDALGEAEAHLDNEAIADVVADLFAPRGAAGAPGGAGGVVISSRS